MSYQDLKNNLEESLLEFLEEYYWYIGFQKHITRISFYFIYLWDPTTIQHKSTDVKTEIKKIKNLAGYLRQS